VEAGIALVNLKSNGADNPGPQNALSTRTFNGKSLGVAVADYNKDCWPDIFVANTGHKVLYSLDVTDNKPNITLEQWQAQTNAHGRQDQKSKFVWPLDLSNVPDPTKVKAAPAQTVLTQTAQKITN
jgi:hypothetical protein